MRSKFYLVLMISLGLVTSLLSQQVADTLYNPTIYNKQYPQDNGPMIHIDRGHLNFHTRENRFRPFVNVLQQDGYHVADYIGPFMTEQLSKVRILVIANAISTNARAPFVTPTETAFTSEEIKVVEEWVSNGGSLFLIADHMPFAGAAAMLAKRFGFDFTDSFVFDEKDEGIFDFNRADGMLGDNKISNGRNSSEFLNHIKTFTGQGFKIPNEAVSILNLTPDHVVLMPDTMWVFNDETIKVSGEDYSQGAYLTYGKGRVVVFGEAAMFTGQLAGPDQVKIGMNAPHAEENYQLLLNIIHWLDRVY